MSSNPNFDTHCYLGGSKEAAKVCGYIAVMFRINQPQGLLTLEAVTVPAHFSGEGYAADFKHST